MSASVFRIVKKRYARQAYSGEGARLVGGRWNAPGTRVVYASPALSLAALELFVHLDLTDTPEDLVFVRADLPGDWEGDRLQVSDLPRNWRSYPAPRRLQEIGSDWVRRGRSPLLWVPSAVIPSEWNALINPVHPRFAELEVAKSTPFRFDPRMWK